MSERHSSQLRSAAGTAPAPVRPQSRRTFVTGSTRSKSSNIGAGRQSESSILSLNRTCSDLTDQQAWQSGTDMRIVRLFKHPRADKWFMTVRPDGTTDVTVLLKRPWCEPYISVAFSNAYNNWETQARDLKGLLRIVRLDYEWRKRPDGRVEVRNVNWPRGKQPKGGASWADYAGALAQVPLVIPAAIHAAFHHKSDLQHAFSRQ